MGLFDFLKNKTPNKEEQCPPGYKVVGRTDYGAPIYGEIEPKLHTVDKERIMVDQITSTDMQQFNMMPFNLIGPVKKFVKEGSHPFAYIDLDEMNQIAAKQEIEQINEYIIKAKNYIPRLTQDIKIDISKVVFQQYDKSYGYSRIMCTPYTFHGKISKYPLSLLFMSKYDIRSYSVTGELFYGKDGKVGKANVSIIKNGIQWIFHFKTLGRTFILFRAKTSLVPDVNGLPSVVYEFRE